MHYLNIPSKKTHEDNRGKHKNRANKIPEDLINFFKRNNKNMRN